MKEKFLKSKNKRVLRTICKELGISEKEYKKANKDKLINTLLKYSNSNLKNIYNQTWFGYNRQRITKAAKDGEAVGIEELERINKRFII